MGNLLTLRFFCFSFCPKSRTSLEQDSVEEKWHLPCEVNLSSPNRKGHNQNLKATSKPISQDSRAARLQDKLFNLVEKVNTLQWNHPVQTSSSISIPVKSGRNIADLQKKIESLKLQVLKERNQRQAVAQQLNTLRHQNEKDLQHKQKIWENKFRELQKEKYNLSIRLQIENERATESLREAQRQAKERERLLLEQNNALVTQLASLQASYSPKRSNEMAYASLTESLSLKAEILNAQARESALITELEKVERGIGEKSIQFPTKDSGDVSHTLDATKPSSRENYVDLVPHLYQDASNIPLAKSAESQHIFNGR
ncbi:hypothetical protein KP509_1Z211500 [Ceratopteris richardii]|nr:hypothetical protein KP509_1Z211500 [Ceratopteris richardii]